MSARSARIHKLQPPIFAKGVRIPLPRFSLQQLYQSRRKLTQWLFPEHCRACGMAGAALCEACARDWPRLPENRCSYCALPLQANGDCPVCSVEAPQYDHVYTPFVYAEPLNAAILAWKFHQRLDWTRALATTWADGWGGQAPSHPECLLPVPLHPKRLRERGYNQALLLARHWGKRWHIPVKPGVLRRCRNTRHQTGLSAAARRENLDSAFTLHGKLPAHVAIVDDVMTTGTTAGQIAELLKNVGVQRIDVWVLARALRETVTAHA
jgi:Predicted amidophosphoribosyltransferases